MCSGYILRIRKYLRTSEDEPNAAATPPTTKAPTIAVATIPTRRISDHIRSSALSADGYRRHEVEHVLQLTVHPAQSPLSLVR